MQDAILSFLVTSAYTSVLALLVGLLFALLKNRIAIRAKYWAWNIILLAFLIPFRPQFGQGFFQLPILSAGSLSQARDVAMTSTGATSQATSQSDFWAQLAGLPWLEIFLVLWLCGCLFSLARYLLSHLKFRRMLTRWGQEIKDEHSLASLLAVQRRLAIKGQFELLHYPLAPSPMLLGFRKPIIILPEKDYTEEELSLIFQHELTHYKHRDMYVNLGVLLLKSLYWFNPAVAFACKETQEVSEMYCDDAVLQGKDIAYRSFYGETILTMIDRSKKSPLALTTCFYSNKFKLKRRIVAIMDNRLPQKLLSTICLIFLPIFLLLSSSVLVVAKSPSQAPASLFKASKSSELSPTQAVQAALKDNQLSQKDISNLQVVRQATTYKVQFSHANVTYETYIRAKDGAVIRSNKTSLVEKKVPETSTASSSQETPASQPAVSPAGNDVVSQAPAGEAATSSSASSTNTTNATSSDSDDDKDDKDHDTDDTDND